MKITNCSAIAQMDQFFASDGAADDRFGTSVATSGDFAIIGAHYDDDYGSTSGSVYVYKYNSTSDNWSQTQKLTPSDASSSQQFGVGVGMYQDLAIIGAWFDGDGSAYIFHLDNSSSQWIQTAKLTGTDISDTYHLINGIDNFGYTVDITTDYAIVGTVNFDFDESGYDGDSFHAYVFTMNSNDVYDWSQTAILQCQDGCGLSDRFGRDVGISTNYAVVGAPSWNSEAPGKAYVFKRDETDDSWSQVAVLNASDGANGYEFGAAVDISENGNVIVVGSPEDTSSGYDGSIYIFERNQSNSDGTDWTQTNKFRASTTYPVAFGDAVAISSLGNTVVAGSVWSSWDGKGTAYAFEKDSSTGDWSYSMQLVGTTTASHDYFGVSVAIDKKFAVVGACYDDDLGTTSGSAYVFEGVFDPTAAPTSLPTSFPTSPSLMPSNEPTFVPTSIPTSGPTSSPTSIPSGMCAID